MAYAALMPLACGTMHAYLPSNGLHQRTPVVAGEFAQSLRPSNSAADGLAPDGTYSIARSNAGFETELLPECGASINIILCDTTCCSPPATVFLALTMTTGR